MDLNIWPRLTQGDNQQDSSRAKSQTSFQEITRPIDIKGENYTIESENLLQLWNLSKYPIEL